MDQHQTAEEAFRNTRKCTLCLPQKLAPRETELHCLPIPLCSREAASEQLSGSIASFDQQTERKAQIHRKRGSTILRRGVQHRRGLKIEQQSNLERSRSWGEANEVYGPVRLYSGSALVRS